MRGLRIGLGGLLLSTAPERDEERSRRVIQAAVDAGVRLFDTAPTYARDESELGHNERLLASALGGWRGDHAAAIEVVTKCGMSRRGRRWVADGRARAIAGSAEASRASLGVERLDLLLLHAVDPRTPLATSVRALAELKRQGLVAEVGLSNVGVGQLEEALELVEVAAVEVELSPFHDDAVRGGVVERCLELGIRLLAHRPLGGATGVRRLGRHEVVTTLATRHGVSPAELALAWLLDLHPGLELVAGATRPETIASWLRAAALDLDDEARERLDDTFPFARVLRRPRAERRPADDGDGEVVLLMGIQAAGKSTSADDLVDAGYQRLNRDERGGRLGDLLPELDRLLATGRRRVVLDNTYPTRAARNRVLEVAWAHGVPVRCIWLDTTLEQAQVNACERMLERHGALLGPEEIKRLARQDPAVFGPRVPLAYSRELEPPAPAEGFSRIERREFVPRPTPGRTRRALLIDIEGVLCRSRAGERTPRDAADFELLDRRKAALEAHAAAGYSLLGLSWQPGLGDDSLSRAALDGWLARLRDELGRELEVALCPHPPGPPVCWCRKPLPGLGVEYIRRHGIDPAASLHVGEGAAAKGFARRCGLRFVAAEEFFADGSSAAEDDLPGARPSDPQP